MRKISFVVTNTNFEKLDEFKKDVLNIIAKNMTMNLFLFQLSKIKKNSKILNIRNF